MIRPLPKNRQDFYTQMMKTSSRSANWWFGLIVAVVTSAWFGSGIGSEPSFVDEWAYLSQAYFTDLLISGRRNDPAWLEYPGYDLPPLPKYLIGGSLRLAGLPRPPRDMMVRWYNNTSTKTGTDDMLRAGRWPSAVLGGLGCAMIYAIGVLVGGRRLGLIAAILLAINPLYRLHARRAMSDVPAEALILLTLAIGLWALHQRWQEIRISLSLMISVIVGILGGLAVLAKLNGALALMTIGAWATMEAILCSARKLATVNQSNESTTVQRLVVRAGEPALLTLISAIVGFATFTFLNPYMTAKPPGAMIPSTLAEVARLDLVGRAKLVASHRAGVSTQAANLFPHNALRTLPDKVAAVTVQGFGRFGPLGPGHTDSTKRFDLAQDWGAAVWLPLVLGGLMLQIRKTHRQWRSATTPTSLALILMSAIAFLVVTLFIPLAWDRYFLSIQASAALLGATTINALVALLRPRPTKPAY